MKIFRLFINENIKTWKKFSTKMLIVIVLLSIVAVLGMAKLMGSLEGNIPYVIDNNNEESIKMQIEYLKEELKNANLDEESKAQIQSQIDEYQIYLDYGIEQYGNTWKNDIVNQITNAKLSGETEKVNQLIGILKENSFEKYVENQKEILQQDLKNKIITEQEYNDSKQILELKAKYDIGKNAREDSWKNDVIKEIENCQKSIRTGINQTTRKVLKVEEKQELENIIKIDIYRLENTIPPAQQDSNNNYRMRYEMMASTFGIAIISIVAIIIAGGAISTETSEGTIKFWALTPNKRWKILTAKLLSLLFYIIVITLICSIFSIIIANVFFDDRGETYLYMHNGQVKEIGNTLYTIEQYLVKSIPIIIFALFAMMLSVVTRNTAVSVSIGIALYMGNGIFMAIINNFVHKDWVKYIPFNNLDIADKIFPNSAKLLDMGFNTFAKSTSLGFSFTVLGVCAILMLVTMYDSFNKRDII